MLRALETKAPVAKKFIRLFFFAAIGILVVSSSVTHAIHSVSERGNNEGDTKSEPAPSVNRVFIFVDRVNTDGVLAEDGRFFPFSSYTKVMGKKQPHAKKQIAELVFDGDRLIHVNLR